MRLLLVDNHDSYTEKLFSFSSRPPPPSGSLENR